MNSSDKIAILRQTYALCSTHKNALKDALQDIDQREFVAPDLGNLSRQDRRLLDQFAYRYTRLQDDMGSRLFPSVLRALGENIPAMSMLDRLDRMEQLGWLPQADEWSDLRHIRNEFTHEYPESATERFERLGLALKSARRLVEIIESVGEKIIKRFPG